MSNTVTLTPKFSSLEIIRAVSAVTLPTSLQGVEKWYGSKDIGGNVASHVAIANGRGQTIGLCSLLADWYFGAESRENILKQLKKKDLRNAFDIATSEIIRPKRPTALESSTMLEFLREVVRHGMEQAKISGAPKVHEAITVSEATASEETAHEAPKVHEAITVSEATASEETVVHEATTVSEETAHEATIAMLRAMLDAANAKLQEISKAPTIKAVRAILAA